MKSETYFKEGKNSIGWVGSNFKEHFYGIDFTIPKKLDLKVKKLERNMLDKEILAEFKPKESNLGELAYALKNDICSKDGWANIFYIRDKDNVLWAVRACWGSGRQRWDVGAFSVGDPGEWLAGSRVVSGDFNFETKNDNSLNLSDFEIRIKGKVYRLVEK